ncbi:MAG: class I SAM-dependent methyltransferase [Chloroflexi bacterium]|nr:MAG: class I SAM-dependent methyltransferase [Chloroflexota bacterium]
MQTSEDIVENLNTIFLIGIAIFIVSILLWWLIVTTEGVYLGRNVVIWLYDFYAQRYDTIKNTQLDYELAFTAQPIIDRLPIADPLVLDVASGTGRLPEVLLRHDEFAGQIIAVDLSRAMLIVAAQKLKSAMEQGHVYLLNSPAEKIPLPDNSVDVVTCLEALEFMMNDRVVLSELVRVLRPNGLLVITNRQGRDRYLMLGKVRSHAQFRQLLEKEFDLKIEHVNSSWSDIYALFIARKNGISDPIGTKEALWHILRCPKCEANALQPKSGYAIPTWECKHCGHLIQQAFDGIIDLGL